MLTKEFTEEMKHKLLAQKKKLETDLSGLSQHSEMGDEEDENASEINVDEASQDVIALMTADLAKIDKALAKIVDGSYGTDDDGREIPKARLSALPWADKAI